MAKRKTSEPPAMLELPVEFGGISIGEKTARVGVSIDRANLTVTQADKNLCERRLTGRILARPADELPDQGRLPGMEHDTVINGVFDVKGISLSGRKISLGLTFALKGLDVSVLAHFAKRAGLLRVEAIEALPEADSNGTGDDDHDDQE